MDTLLPTQMFPRLPTHATFVADKFVSGTQNVSDFVQKHFVSATNVSQFAHARKRIEQQCFRNNVSLFATALTTIVSRDRQSFKPELLYEKDIPLNSHIRQINSSLLANKAKSSP